MMRSLILVWCASLAACGGPGFSSKDWSESDPVGEVTTSEASSSEDSSSTTGSGGTGGSDGGWGNESESSSTETSATSETATADSSVSTASSSGGAAGSSDSGSAQGTTTAGGATASTMTNTASTTSVATATATTGGPAEPEAPGCGPCDSNKSWCYWHPTDFPEGVCEPCPQGWADCDGNGPEYDGWAGGPQFGCETRESELNQLGQCGECGPDPSTCVCDVNGNCSGGW